MKKYQDISLGIIFFIIGLFLSAPYNVILYLLSYLIVGRKVVLKAFKNIRRKDFFDENLLMTIATFGAIYLGLYDEAIFVMLFYQIGELFQLKAINKSRAEINSLINLKQDFVKVKVADEYVEKDVEELEVDDIISISLGEKIPVDCKVISNSALIDTSSLTGEALPISVKENDEVLSGCSVIAGNIVCQVIKTYENSTIYKILELIENSLDKKAKTEKFITRFSKIYTPIVIISAILVLLVNIVVFKIDINDALYRSLIFLVVSCPCALIISIPLSFFSAIGLASKNNILIKGSEYLEALSQAKVVVFDKTGTLTQGNFKVEQIVAKDKEQLIRLAANAQIYSNHLLAKAIKKTYKNELEEEKISNYEEISGQGIKCNFDQKLLLVGNNTLLEKYDLEFEKVNANGSVIYVAYNHEYLGYLILNDMIKDNSIAVIKKLRSNKIDQMIMLTGDSDIKAKEVSEKLDLDIYYSQLLPQEKNEHLKAIIKESKGKVVYVGDGVNDAPCLKMADIGISMGQFGSDLAIESSDIVIMNDDLEKINLALNIAKKTMIIVKENIIFSLLIKFGVLILSAIGHSNLMIGVFADVGVTIITVLNSMRILYQKIKE